MIQDIRHGNKKGSHEAHLHVREKRFRGADENKIALVFDRQGVFQPEKQKFLEIKAHPEEKGQHNGDLDHPVFQLNQVR